MNKKFARRNLLLALGLFVGSVIVTLVSLGYIQFIRNLQ